MDNKSGSDCDENDSDDNNSFDSDNRKNISE